MFYKSLKDHVYQYISDEIKNNKLSSNEKLSEQKICDELNISRTPVREALIQLSSDGLLEITPRRGFRVKSLSLKEAKDLYEVISQLDVLAVSTAFNNISDSDLSQMEKLVNDMDYAIKKYDFDTYYSKQIQFHNVYIEQSDNQILKDTLYKLKQRFLRQSYSHIEAEQARNVLLNTNNEHKQILKYFKEKNLEALKAELTRHWNLNYAQMDSLDIEE